MSTTRKKSRRPRVLEHVLKALPEPFDAVWRGWKTHEFRRDDRGFQVGDRIRLREYFLDADRYSNREVRARVTYVSHGPQWGIPEGYVAMSLSVVQRALR